MRSEYLTACTVTQPGRKRSEFRGDLKKKRSVAPLGLLLEFGVGTTVTLPVQRFLLLADSNRTGIFVIAL